MIVNQEKARAKNITDCCASSTESCEHKNKNLKIKNDFIFSDIESFF